MQQPTMYVEAGVCDEDHEFNSEQVSRNRGNRFAPWLVALILSTVAYGGHVLWSFGPNPSAPTDAVGQKFDLSTEKVKIPLVVEGMVYCQGHAGKSMDAAVDQPLFRKTVADAIGKQAGVVVPHAGAPNFKNEKCSISPARTEFEVEFDVPVEITAAALVSRLDDGRKFRKAVQDALLKAPFKAASVVEPIGVQSQVPQIATVKGTASAVTSVESPIILDLSIKGVTYTDLAKAGTPGAPGVLQQSFAKAIQEAIAAGVPGLKSTSIGLDIHDGLKDTNDVHWVMVTATIPPPAGLSADVTMSSWPGGPDVIGASLQKSLRGLTGIEGATAGGLLGVTKILVYPGPLHFGALRQVYSSKITLRITGTDWTTNANTETALYATVQKSLAAAGGVDKSDVTVTMCPTSVCAGNAVDVAKPLLMQAVISADGLASVASKSAWEKHVLAALKNSTAQWKSAYPVQTKFKLTAVLPFDSAYEVASVDLNFVIQGIEYSQLTADTKPAFLTDLVKQIRVGVGTQLTVPLETVEEQKVIKVSVSPGRTAGSLDVLVKVPQDTAVLANAELKSLQKSLTTFYTNVAVEVRKVPGLQYFTSWTTSSIKVVAPGVKAVTSL